MIAKFYISNLFYLLLEKHSQYNSKLINPCRHPYSLGLVALGPRLTGRQTDVPVPRLVKRLSRPFRKCRPVSAHPVEGVIRPLRHPTEVLLEVTLEWQFTGRVCCNYSAPYLYTKCRVITTYNGRCSGEFEPGREGGTEKYYTRIKN